MIFHPHQIARRKTSKPLFKHRMPSRAAAVRELLQIGLAASDRIKDPTGMKSANIGVFGRGENSHDGKED